MHQGPSPEGRDAAGRVGPQFSVDLTHVDSDSAPQVDESFLDALDNDLQPRRRRFRRVHSVSENVSQWGTEGRFAVLSSELEEACPSFEATTVPASSKAVRAAHRICTDTESSTEVVEPIPVQNSRDVNHRHQRRRLVVYQSQTEPTFPHVPDSHDERLQRVREAIWQELHNMPREVRRVRDMFMRLVDRVGHVRPQRRRDPQRNSPAAVVISEHSPHVGGCHGGPFQCCFAVVGCVSTGTRPSWCVERVCQAMKQ